MGAKQISICIPVFMLHAGKRKRLLEVYMSRMPIIGNTQYTCRKILHLFKCVKLPTCILYFDFSVYKMILKPQSTYIYTSHYSCCEWTLACVHGRFFKTSHMKIKTLSSVKWHLFTLSNWYSTSANGAEHCH